MRFANFSAAFSFLSINPPHVEKKDVRDPETKAYEKPLDELRRRSGKHFPHTAHTQSDMTSQLKILGEAA